MGNLLSMRFAHLLSLALVFAVVRKKVLEFVERVGVFFVGE